eukprot:7378412-Prymnesium_polylepis.2
MQRAADACEALDVEYPLRIELERLELLGDIRPRMAKARADRGAKPSVPNKWQYSMAVPEQARRERPSATGTCDSVRCAGASTRPRRHVWRPLSSTERNRKSRKTGALGPLKQPCSPLAVPASCARSARLRTPRRRPFTVVGSQRTSRCRHAGRR